MLANKRWVRMGPIKDSPDGVFYLDKVKYATNPENGDVWAYIRHPGEPEKVPSKVTSLPVQL